MLGLAPGASAAVISVPLATLYAAPGKALLPADPERWLLLSTAQRRALVGRVETQAVIGERVVVLARRGTWVKVAVPDQPTPKNRLGYPGWLPAAQLSSTTVVVTAPVKLPVTGADIVRTARGFLGVPYLWGGVSAYGFDCSGLAWALYRAHGIEIPRDADAQAAAGRPVALAGERSGDLLFYGRPQVDHVGVYAGGGRMIESPYSGSAVRLTQVRTASLAAVRRYLR